MKFGVREFCDVVFKAKSKVKIGELDFVPGQPVLYIDTAKTSTVESASTTVYATGGKGNSRLIAWEGEKTLTFTVEDALLSPIGFAVLSGAGLFKAAGSTKPIYVHTTAQAFADGDGKIDLKDVLGETEKISGNSPVFVAVLKSGSIDTMISDCTIADDGKSLTSTATKNKDVFVDFYIEKTSGVTQLEIDAGNFAGFYYVEASTLFRRESDGVDMPAEIIIPNVKVQSNFTFTMASSGDPSTITFTMDAFPGYTRFDRSKKLLCAIQIVDDDTAGTVEGKDSVGNRADDEATYPVEEDAEE